MLIIEDGTGVIGANSYATLAVVRTYNEMRGVELPDDDDAVAALMIVAVDYLGTYEDRWQGQRTFPATQRLAWPRDTVKLFGAYFPSNGIPQAVIDAQAYLVGIATTVDLNAVQDTRAIIGEKIGPIETQYSATAGATTRPMIPLLEAMLKPLLKVSVGTLRTVRV